MPYTVQSSEKLRKSGAEGETKALLYLMNFRSDSNEIHYFVVDFFNDLTGMDRYAEKLWDVQSKAAKNNSPNAIGKELVTLFKNFVSDLEFAFYILFIGGVTSTLRIDDSLSSFGFDNIKPESQKKLISGLIEEAKAKTYINNELITCSNISNFLSKVTFVIDDKTPCEYVREIIKDHPAIIPSDNDLIAIFNEIRDKQGYSLFQLFQLCERLSRHLPHPPLYPRRCGGSGGGNGAAAAGGISHRRRKPLCRDSFPKE